MNIMTKHGSQDNIVTYEHYCDTKADLANIPQDQISLGSVAIVLKDEDDSMGIYLANSSKEWIPFSNSGGGSGMSDISLTNLLDISLANPADGQTLVYNGKTEKWENKGNNLVGLDDVDISNPADGDTLTSDSTNEKWVAQAGGESGIGVMVVNIDYESGQEDTYEDEPCDSYLCDKTPYEIYDHLQNGGTAYFKLSTSDTVYYFWIDHYEYNIKNEDISVRFTAKYIEVNKNSLSDNWYIIEQKLIYSTDSEGKVFLFYEDFSQ